MYIIPIFFGANMKLLEPFTGFLMLAAIVGLVSLFMPAEDEGTEPEEAAQT